VSGAAAADTIVVDAARCVGCGLCVGACPTKTMALDGKKAVVTAGACLTCGHCQAVCPEGAVRVAGLDPFCADFATFETRTDWLAPGQADAGELVRLMRSRRSVRSYLARPVPREALLDLVRAGISAPSGHNSQKWAFTILPDRPAVAFLAQALAGFFRTLNKMAANPLIRLAMRLVRRPELGDYYREHYASVQRALDLWERDGTDLLFHGAPAAIVVSSRPGASCPAEDALLASQNMLLAAHAMGLGACMIGYAVAAMQNDKKIQPRLGIGRDETVYAVIALGYSSEKYQRVTGRLRPPIRFFHAPQGTAGTASPGPDQDTVQSGEI